MPSLTSAVMVAATMVAVASAQYKIDPDSVPQSLREYWCQSEVDTCPMICQQYTSLPTLVNTCDPDTLTYGCLCGDNQKPNITEYTLTLPYYVCTEWGNQCVTNCNGDNSCASDCRQKHPCGANDPKRAKHKSSSAKGTATVAPVSSSASAAADTIYTGIPGQSSDSSSGSSTSSSVVDSGKDSAAVGLGVGRTCGLGIVGASIVGLLMLL